MSYEVIRNRILNVIRNYEITRVTLFGSRAEGTNREDSDVDLIVEFSRPVSLMELAQLQIELEDSLELHVDVVHGPIQEDDLIEVGRTVELYAA